MNEESPIPQESIAVTPIEPKNNNRLLALLIGGVVVVGIAGGVAYWLMYKEQPAESAAATTLPAQSGQEMINGIPVPPEPDPTVNNSTLAGIDSNNNGVRDDVERMIAKKSSGPNEFSNAVSIAKTYQSILVATNLTQNDYDSKIVHIVCADVNGTDNIRSTAIAMATLNTDSRTQAYKQKTIGFAGQAIDAHADCKDGPAETINGIAVPPEPDQTVNNATLAGIDVNDNGVRDDIDRVVAKQFGGTSDYSFALTYAREYQNLVVAPTPKTRVDALTVESEIMCSLNGASDSVYRFKINELTTNTPARLKAERNFLDVLGGFTRKDLGACPE